MQELALADGLAGPSHAERRCGEVSAVSVSDLYINTRTPQPTFPYDNGMSFMESFKRRNIV